LISASLAQKTKLEEQLAAAHAAELEMVIAQTHQIVVEYGLTAEDIGLAAKTKKRKGPHPSLSFSLLVQHAPLAANDPNVDIARALNPGWAVFQLEVSEVERPLRLQRSAHGLSGHRTGYFA